MSMTFYEFAERIARKSGVEVEDIEIQVYDSADGVCRDLYPSEVDSSISGARINILTPKFTSEETIYLREGIDDLNYFDRIIDTYILNTVPKDIQVYQGVDDLLALDQDSRAAVVFLPKYCVYLFTSKEESNAELQIVYYGKGEIKRKHYIYEIKEYGLQRESIYRVSGWLININTFHDMFMGPTTQNTLGIQFAQTEKSPYSGERLYLAEKENIGYVRFENTWIQSTYNWIKSNIETFPEGIQSEWQLYLQTKGE